MYCGHPFVHLLWPPSLATHNYFIFSSIPISSTSLPHWFLKKNSPHSTFVPSQPFSSFFTIFIFFSSNPFFPVFIFFSPTPLFTFPRHFHPFHIFHYLFIHSIFIITLPHWFSSLFHPLHFRPFPIPILFSCTPLKLFLSTFFIIFSFTPFSSCHPFHICFHRFLTHSTFVPSLPFSYFSSNCTSLLSISTILIICSSTPLLSFPHFHFLSPHHFHPSFIHSTSSFFHQPHNFHAFIFFIHFTFVPSKLSSFFHALHFPPFTCFSSFFHSFHFSPFTHFHFFHMLQFHPFAQILHFFSTPIFIPFTILFLNPLIHFYPFHIFIRFLSIPLLSLPYFHLLINLVHFSPFHILIFFSSTSFSSIPYFHYCSHPFFDLCLIKW